MVYAVSVSDVLCWRLYPAGYAWIWYVYDGYEQETFNLVVLEMCLVYLCESSVFCMCMAWNTCVCVGTVWRDIMLANVI